MVALRTHDMICFELRACVCCMCVCALRIIIICTTTRRARRRRRNVRKLRCCYLSGSRCDRCLLCSGRLLPLSAIAASACNMQTLRRVCVLYICTYIHCIIYIACTEYALSARRLCVLRREPFMLCAQRARTGISLIQTLNGATSVGSGDATAHGDMNFFLHCK